MVLYHVNVRSADMSVDRVAYRTKTGDHDVPVGKIRERYARNQVFIKEAAMGADFAHVYDNSIRGKAPERSIYFKNGQVAQVAERVPAWARDLYKIQCSFE